MTERGPWEKYVEQAAEAMNAAGMVDEDDVLFVPVENAARALLAAVGPLIAEDTRERMVAAAGRALEKEASHKPGSLYYCATSGEIEQYPGGGFDVCCELGPAGHEPISEIAFRAVWKQAAAQCATDERGAARQAMMDGLIAAAEEQERPSIAEWLRAVR